MSLFDFGWNVEPQYRYDSKGIRISVDGWAGKAKYDIPISVGDVPFHEDYNTPDGVHFTLLVSNETKRQIEDAKRDLQNSRDVAGIAVLKGVTEESPKVKNVPLPK